MKKRSGTKVNAFVEGSPFIDGFQEIEISLVLTEAEADRIIARLLELREKSDRVLTSFLDLSSTDESGKVYLPLVGSIVQGGVGPRTIQTIAWGKEWEEKR